MEDKITIIEGPPPTFEAVTDGWVLGLSDSPTLADMAVTQLRTFNGPALVERCYRAWNNRQAINLEVMGSNPIHDDNATALNAGAWIRLTDDTVELELGYDDDMGDDEDLDFPDIL